MMNRLIIILAVIIFSACSKENKLPETVAVKQKALARVDQMPYLPQPLKIIDWREKALSFDKLVFDENQTGDFWPLIWIDSSKKNFDSNTFGLYTAIGDVRQGPDHNNGIFHESLGTVGAVLGASLVGIDKENQNGYDYVDMLKNYFNSDTEWNIVMNNTCPEVALLGGGYGRDWWYDVYPNLLYYAVSDLYEADEQRDAILHQIAEQFCKADSVLNGNYDYSYFNYAEMKPYSNWICKQQDAAAGHAYVLYMAYQKFGDERYLEGAKSATEALLSQETNRFYEILMPFGAYTAARLNAEHGTNYDVKKILEWSFNGDSECRVGWGVLQDSWNGYDVSGLVGSTHDMGGYAFLMNTFDMAWALVPMVKYGPEWSNVVGKWMLNAANATRLFYPYEMPDNHQTIPGHKEATKGVIAYEGIIKKSAFPEYENIEAPVAQGDGPNWVKGENPPESQFSVYGSAHAGIFGSIISTTEVEGVLRLDVNACDFYSDSKFPTYLYYNPYDYVVQITVETGEEELYSLLSHSFVGEAKDGSFVLELKPRSSELISIIPADKASVDKNLLVVDNTVIDYNFITK